MQKTNLKMLRRFGPGVAALALLAGCSDPIDLDLRGKFGGFSTSAAATKPSATGNRPNPDARGVISYPNYQVAVARRGDTVLNVASRIDLPASELARFNGLQPEDGLRDGEVLALPRRVPDAAAPNAGNVDIASLAGSAIDASPDTTPKQTQVATAELAPATAAAPAPKPQPGPEPVRHKVKRGETAYTVSRLYQVPVKALAEWNGLGADFSIREGQYLLIPVPGTERPNTAIAAAAEETRVTEPGEGSATPTPPSAARPLPEERVAALDTPAPVVADVPVAKPTAVSRPDAEMAFPIDGKIIRPYTKGKNDGIDIAGQPGSAVKAATDGKVAAITADADQIPIIVLRHPDNVLTVYANVDGIAVKKGQSVRKGATLAKLRPGDEAYLHFEVRNGFESVDPMPYLQ